MPHETLRRQRFPALFLPSVLMRLHVDFCVGQART
jgi:hypothetical protein